MSGTPTSRVEVAFGDLLAEDVDAIVNPANEQLHNLGGLALAISKQAGPAFDAACVQLAPICTGSAKVSVSGQLAQGSVRRSVINAVGPEWRDDAQNEVRYLLGAVHCAIVRVASENGLTRVSVPTISTGIFRYPPDKAAPVAIHSTLEALDEHPDVELVRFVMLDPQDSDKLTIYQAALTAALAARST